MNEYLERYGRGGRQVSMLETEKYIYDEGGGSLTCHAPMHTARCCMQSNHTVGSLCIFDTIHYECVTTANSGYCDIKLGSARPDALAAHRHFNIVALVLEINSCLPMCSYHTLNCA